MVNNDVDTDEYVKQRKGLEVEREKNSARIHSLKRLREGNDEVVRAVALDRNGVAALDSVFNRRLGDIADQVKMSGRRAEMDMSDEIEALHRKNRHVEEDIAAAEQQYRRAQQRLKESLKKEGE